MNDYNLVLAVSGKERREYLCEHYRGIEEECSQGLKSWRNRKSIVKPDQFQWMLLSNEITLEEFSVGVKKLNSKDIQLLYHFIQTESWYKLHREILKDTKDVWKYADEDGFRLFARPYLNWLQKNLNLMLRDISIKVTEGAKEAFIEAAFNEILEIIKKTLVYDHAEEYKPDQEVDNWFLSYACERFADESMYNIFFNDYPVLARLLAARVHYTMVNIQEFIAALEESREKLKAIFDLEGDFILQDIRLNRSDSHNKGKTVILFILNGEKLVFKYKNLIIGDKLNEFFAVIERLNPSIAFYKVKRITTSEYTIEEYIEHEPCLSTKDVSQFYRHFGGLVCISYVLCGNDLHLENVISKRNYPVLIDVETFIQNQIAAGNEFGAKRQYLLNVNDSILGSHLLPSVFEVNGGEKSLEISALSGDEQMAPFKVLQLMNDEKGRMRMEYQQYIMEGAENIPVFRNKKTNFKDYFDEIWQGFSETYQVICINKVYIQTIIEKLFSKLQVRNVLKGTQKYADILNFAYHPSYMTNYINRDKLFENIWAHPHNNPTLIKYEVEDLLVNDIPVFYNQTNKKSLITSEKKELLSYYSISALENVQRRLARFSERDLLAQKNHLCIALGKFRGEVNPVLISSGKESNSPLERAKQITDYEDLCG